MTDDRRSRLSNAAAAVWPTPDSRKVEARMMRKALRKYCIKFTVVLCKVSTLTYRIVVAPTVINSEFFSQGYCLI